MSLDQYLARADTPSAGEFARLVDIDPATISRFRRGIRPPTLAQALAIEVATGGSVVPRSFLRPGEFEAIQNRALAPVIGSIVRIVRNGPHAGRKGQVRMIATARGVTTLHVDLGDFIAKIPDTDTITVRAR